MHLFDIATSKSGPNLTCFVHFLLRNVLRATTACTFSTSQLPKVVRTWCVLTLFTSNCASRHNGVHFFNISTSKSRPTLTCFDIFYVQMCFAPQRRALFPTSQLPKVLRAWCVLPLLTSKSASRHNGVQFFLSHLPRCLRTRSFSEPTFRPSGATKHWKNTVFRDFPTFSRTCIFSLLTFSISELLLSCTAFSSLHIVGSLASKLPSIIYIIYIHMIIYYVYILQGRSQHQNFTLSKALITLVPCKRLATNSAKLSLLMRCPAMSCC